MPGLAHTQYGDHYPLVDPSDDIKYLISDLTVSYENPRWEYSLPLSIAYFDREQGYLKIKNIDNSIIFNAQADDIRDWGSHYKIFSWNSKGFAIKMAINSEINTTTIIEPQSAIIDLRAVYLSPPHITSINGYTGDIKFQAGYNVSMKSDDSNEELRQGAQIDIDAVAGKGKGTKTGSAITAKSTGLKFLAGAGGDDNGAIFMAGEGGPQVTSGCHFLAIGNSNEPCCHCEDMENLGTYMNAVSHKYKILGAYTKWIYEKYTSIIQQWKNRCADDDGEDPPEDKPVTGLVKPPVAIKLWLVAGGCPYVRLKIQITNLNKVAWCDLKLKGTFTPSMCRFSEIYTTTTASEGKMLVWVNDVIKDIFGRYAESTYTANRYPIRLRDRPDATQCEFGDIHWQGNIAPGESVFYMADFKLEEPIPPRRKIDIEFHIDNIDVEYADDTNAHLFHIKVGPHTPQCRFGEKLHGVLYQPAILNGNHKITTTIDCNETVDDTVENPDRAKDIADEIYKIRENLWPCVEDLSNAGNS